MAALLDTNQLLRLSQRGDPDYAVINRAVGQMRRRREQLCITTQNIVEFWSVATRPPSARGGYGLTPTEAEVRVRRFLRRFDLLSDTPAVFDEWRRLVVAHSVSGVQVHDARLAAAMRVHGVGTIITFNTADFARFPGIAAVHPKDV